MRTGTRSRPARAGRPAATAAVLAGVVAAGAAALAGCGTGASTPAPPGSASGATRTAGTPGPAPTAGPRSSPAATAAGPAAARIPRPAHVVVVVLENHAYGEIIGSSQAPFINSLARHGALFTASYAVTHPSEPNYLALFSGSTQGVTSDQCPVTFRGPNLASELIRARFSFAGYAEDLPARGSLVCSAGEYARKHVPWADFSNIPRTDSLPFTRFPADFARLPTVAFVTPNLCNDMHDCAVATGDAWLREHLGGYLRWAMRHDSLLILTWDEDDGSQANQITTIFAGQRIRPGRYRQRITHYNVLRTIEQAYGLPLLGNAALAAPISRIWR